MSYGKHTQDSPQIITIAPVNHAELANESDTALAIAQGMEINSVSMYQLAGEELVSVKAKIKLVEEKRISITAPLTAAHRATMSLFKPYLDRLEEAKKYLETGMLTFKNSQPESKVVAEGNAVRKTWIAECHDKQALVKFVAENPAYLAALDVNQSALNAFAKSQQTAFAIAGCTAKQKESITSRTATF